MRTIKFTFPEKVQSLPFQMSHTCSLRKRIYLSLVRIYCLVQSLEGNLRSNLSFEPIVGYNTKHYNVYNVFVMLRKFDRLCFRKFPLFY